MAASILGQLGAVAIAGNSTLTQVYRVPANRRASVNLTIAPRAATSGNIRIAHIKNDTVANVANEDYLLYDFPNSALATQFAPIEKTGLLLAAGDTIAVYSSGPVVSAQVNGIEEDA